MSVGNPYVVERPLTEGDLFVGRYSLLVEVTQQLKRGRQIVLVYGPTRMGRTSFLYQLANELSPGFWIVNVTLSWPSDGGAREAVAQLQHTVAATAPRHPLGEGVPVVVLVDGLSVSHLGGDQGDAWLVACQEWLASAPRAQLVVAVEGSRPTKGALFSPALASLPSVELQGLTLEETEDLLLKPARGRLTYEFDAVRRIWQLTSGHPYFVQLFGYTLFQLHSGRNRVSLHDLEGVVRHVLTAGQPVMERLWRSCSPEAQVSLVLANELRGRHGVLTVNELCSVAQQRGVDQPTIEMALAELLGKGILLQLSAESYRFSLDLFRQWIEVNHPLYPVLDSRGRRTILASRRSRFASLRWSSVVAYLAVATLLALVLALWNMRGAAQRLVMGSSATSTPAPFATRGTVIIGSALGEIAYMAKENPDATWDIWAMRGDGSDPRRLTEDPGNDMTPTWSADGRHIAFVSDRDGNRELYVMNADGTQQINLTHHASEDWTPAWSPDGESIAFASYRDGNWEIYTMDADGSHPQRLTRSNGADYAPCWSPDGRYLAFQSNRDGNWEIYVIARDGTELQRLTTDEATDSAPAWSPDGAMIAFESYRDGNMEIYLMAADGSDQHCISDDAYSNEHGPAWARGGARLLYHSNRDGGWDIFSMRPDGTEKSNLTLNPALEQRAAWHE